MNVFTIASTITITCIKRLAPYVKREVEELGYVPDEVFQTGVSFMGKMEDCIRLNLNLRCASQVLFQLGEFTVDDPQELYQSIFVLPWEDILKSDGYFSITSSVNHPSITNTMFLNQKVKDAIVDRIRNKKGVRPNTGPDLKQAVVFLYWKNGRATIHVDTSGETLSKHGYRLHPGKAPMLEALVSATLLASQWDRKSLVINPMGGSGTIAIEAALMATGRKPGLLRKNYAFMHLVNYLPEYYEAELGKIKGDIKEIPKPIALCSDINPQMIQLAKANARDAGVEDYIRFDVLDFEKVDPPSENKGIIFFNPPYGDRLGEEMELETLYGRIGDFLKKKGAGYWGYVFTGNLDLAKKIGLKPKKRLEFFSATLDCRLLEFELYEGKKPEK